MVNYHITALSSNCSTDGAGVFRVYKNINSVKHILNMETGLKRSGITAVPEIFFNIAFT